MKNLGLERRWAGRPGAVERAAQALAKRRRGNEAKALAELVAWRSRKPDRFFQLHCLSLEDTSDHPWSVRLEVETQSWSCTEDAHESLARAATFALKRAAAEGYA